MSPPTQSNHILDAVITRVDECPINGLTVTDPLLSDHRAVTFTLDTKRPPLPRKQLVHRQLKKININQFRDDISSDIYLNGKFLKEETDMC